MIKFLQHSSSRYPPRTFENASADATIAFAFDLTTPGEKLTKEAVGVHSKLYIPVHGAIFGSERLLDLKINSVANTLRDHNVSTINIAGNQLATCIKYGHNQISVDKFTVNFLRAVFRHPVFNIQNITLIRSGGQSGFDEAGLKAAVELDIPGLCVCPQGWKFNDATGATICDEQRFKNRFPSYAIM